MNKPDKWMTMAMQVRSVCGQRHYVCSYICVCVCEEVIRILYVCVCEFVAICLCVFVCVCM